MHATPRDDPIHPLPLPPKRNHHMPLRDLTTTEATLSSPILLQFTRHQQQKAHGYRREKGPVHQHPHYLRLPPGVASFPLSLHKSLHASLFYCHSPERDKLKA